MREYSKTKNSLFEKTVVRFGIVGAVNTLFNYLVLNAAYYTFVYNKVVANIISTSLTIVLSFNLNRIFVFKHQDKAINKFLIFALITALGALVVNNLVFIMSLRLFYALSVSLSLTLGKSGINIRQDFIQINLSATVATLFSMFWNYNGYKRIVFKSTD